MTLPRVYICSPNKHATVTRALLKQATEAGFEAVSAITHTDQTLTEQGIFQRNVELIQSCPFFVAVLLDYGKDLTAEVGMAYAWNKNSVGLDYNALSSDVMSYYALDRVVPPESLSIILADWLWMLDANDAYDEAYGSQKRGTS